MQYVPVMSLAEKSSASTGVGRFLFSFSLEETNAQFVPVRADICFCFFSVV